MVEKRSEKGRSRKMIIWIVLVSVLVPMAIIALRIDNWSRDWTTNHASLEATAENPNLRPLQLPGTQDEIAEKIQSWVKEQGHWKTNGMSIDELVVTLYLTRKTTIGFTDDVTVELRPEKSNGLSFVVVHAESQSRVGKGDLGQNPRNLIELVNGLRDE